MIENRNGMEIDGADNCPLIVAVNGIPFGSKMKGKLTTNHLRFNF